MTYSRDKDGNLIYKESGHYVDQMHQGTQDRIDRMKRLAAMSPQTRKMRRELKRGQLPGSRNLLGKGKRRKSRRKSKRSRRKSKRSRRRTRRRSRRRRRRR